MIGNIGLNGSISSLTSKDSQLDTIDRNKNSNNDVERQVDGFQDDKIQPTLKRYIVLALFCFNSCNKAFQWIQVCAVTEKLTYFYNVENFVINATSALFMLSFVFLSWPACYIIERIGIRKAVLLASFGILSGSVIKCFSCFEGGIYLVFLAQILVSLSEQLIFSVPPRLASVWFPDHEVSSAVAISVIGGQFGTALGFVVPQYFLSQMKSKDDIGQGLFDMLILASAISIVAFLLTYLLFDEAPKNPPGLARLRQIEIERQLKIIGQSEVEKSFVEEILNLFCNIFQLIKDKNLLLLTLSFGINNGLYYTVKTILDQMLKPIWKGEDILVGNTGFLIIVSGILCSAFWGKLLDKLHRYLCMNIFLTLSSMFSMILFAYVISALHSMMAIYLAAILFGSFQTGFIVAGLEMGVELTYPAPELVTTSLLNVSPQIFGTVFIFISSYIVDNYGVLASNLFLIACMPVSLIMLLNIKETLKRQNAASEEKETLNLGTELSQKHKQRQ